MQSALRTPALQALLIQLGVSLVILIPIYAAGELIGFQITIGLAALLQGVLAAAFSYWLGLAVWWRLMQFLFPGALIAMHALQLPPLLFLAAFLFLLAFYWTTFRTQVPFFPSGPATWSAVEGMLPQGCAIRFVDIGSGLGGLVMHLAQRRPESSFTGIEIAPLPWLSSLLRSRIKRSRGHFVRGDYEQWNFVYYDVVFAYLSPAAMPALWDKAHLEMRPGTLLLSYEFPIPGVDAHISSAPDARGCVIYGWHM